MQPAQLYKEFKVIIDPKVQEDAISSGNFNGRKVFLVTNKTEETISQQIKLYGHAYVLNSIAELEKKEYLFALTAYIRICYKDLNLVCASVISEKKENIEKVPNSPYLPALREFIEAKKCDFKMTAILWKEYFENTSLALFHKHCTECETPEGSWDEDSIHPPVTEAMKKAHDAIFSIFPSSFSFNESSVQEIVNYAVEDELFFDNIPHPSLKEHIRSHKAVKNSNVLLDIARDENGKN